MTHARRWKLSAAQRADMWKRWKAGQSLNAIGRALGKVIRLPEIDEFTLSGQKISDSLYEGVLTGQGLETIEMTGWTPDSGSAVRGIPTPVPGAAQQTLQIAMPWLPPAPHAPLYVWIRGEKQARLTNASY
jgi:hypothetical protein